MAYIHIFGDPKVEKNEGMKKVLNKKCTNLMKTINLEIQETKRMQKTKNMKETILRSIIIKLLKISDK